MSHWNASFTAKQLLTAFMVVVGSCLLLSTCASSRSSRDSKNDDRDSGQDSVTEEDEGGHGSARKDADDNDQNENDASNDPEERDGGDNGISKDKDAGRYTYDADSAGSGGNGGNAAEGPAGEGGSEAGGPTIDVPYESLQPIPNTTARVCPDRGYSDSNASLFASCEHICPNAHCVPHGFVPEEASINAFVPCDEGSVCIPDFMINTSGAIQYKKCRSVGNAEGACIEKCNTMTTSMSTEFLPQDSCHETEVCVPCYDPIGGGLTAFNPCGNYTQLSCNPGPTESGVIFDTCCIGNGTCIPGIEDINPEVATLLKRDSCEGEDDLCLPALFGIRTYRPALCETDSGDEGRCLPDCIASELIEQYGQQDCAAGEHCIPCLRNGVSTGACVLNGDAPGRNSE